MDENPYASPTVPPIPQTSALPDWLDMLLCAAVGTAIVGVCLVIGVLVGFLVFGAGQFL